MRQWRLPNQNKQISNQNFFSGIAPLNKELSGQLLSYTSSNRRNDKSSYLVLA